MLHAFYNWFTRHCLSCRDAARLVSESCERKLSMAERLKLAMLRFMCPYTYRYAEQVRRLHECLPDLAQLDEEPLSEGPPLPAQARARLIEELARGEGKP